MHWSHSLSTKGTQDKVKQTQRAVNKNLELGGLQTSRLTYEWKATPCLSLSVLSCQMSFCTSSQPAGLPWSPATKYFHVEGKYFLILNISPPSLRDHWSQTWSSPPPTAYCCMHSDIENKWNMCNVKTIISNKRQSKMYASHNILKYIKQERGI